MKKIMLVVIVTLFAVSMAFAPLAAATPQQDKMTACNKEAAAKKLTGEERQKFMSDCLKTKPAQTSQQEKMKACNKEATEKKLTGEERKKFMSDCLKTKAVKDMGPSVKEGGPTKKPGRVAAPAK